MHIAYVCIFSSNLEETVRFYRDILGLEEDLARSEKNFHAFKAGGTHIGIERNGVRKEGEKTKAENPVLIQFRVESAEELRQQTRKLEEKGVRILNKLIETHYGTFTNFLDPDGNRLEMLYQP